MGSGAYGWPSTRRCDTPRTGPSADRSPIAGTDRNRSGRTRPSNERPRPTLVRVLAELRSRCDAWHHDPAKLGYAEVVALLGDLSRGCERPTSSGRSSRRPRRLPFSCLLAPAGNFPQYPTTESR